MIGQSVKWREMEKLNVQNTQRTLLILHLARLAYMLAVVGCFKMASVNSLAASSRFPIQK